MSGAGAESTTLVSIWAIALKLSVPPENITGLRRAIHWGATEELLSVAGHCTHRAPAPTDLQRIAVGGTGHAAGSAAAGAKL
jgi:hypothetical protein